MNKNYWAWSYVDGKFDGALDTLCTSFAPNWQRMHDALMHLVALLPSHFPDKDIYDRWNKLYHHATAYGPLMIGERIHRGSIENTMRRRKRSTFEKYAIELQLIHAEIRKRRGPYID